VQKLGLKSLIKKNLKAQVILLSIHNLCCRKIAAEFPFNATHATYATQQT